MILVPEKAQSSSWKIKKIRQTVFLRYDISFTFCIIRALLLPVLDAHPSNRHSHRHTAFHRHFRQKSAAEARHTSVTFRSSQSASRRVDRITQVGLQEQEGQEKGSAAQNHRDVAESGK